ncbi:hypothetical protein BLNAU_19761 [Blattamonas nauphoetae]|uniref:Uncharacterized protein n=1 Tax=Blattamonas nauphoetae TaxID=2049346 RepID=A0ABQ9X148_9EUKA|nr:hypothetical protein BLNAU_19761 [Blattamonas nauphoetae]
MTAIGEKEVNMNPVHRKGRHRKCVGGRMDHNTWNIRRDLRARSELRRIHHQIRQESREMKQKKVEVKEEEKTDEDNAKQIITDEEQATGGIKF